LIPRGVALRALPFAILFHAFGVVITPAPRLIDPFADYQDKTTLPNYTHHHARTTLAMSQMQTQLRQS
jgi:hypothetical protein